MEAERVGVTSAASICVHALEAAVRRDASIQTGVLMLKQDGNVKAGGEEGGGVREGGLRKRESEC